MYRRQILLLERDVGGGFIFVAGQVGVDLKGEVKVGIAE
jgi:enamine deaminase RidA (YjgF/YER057c/UK114 family)